MGNNLVIPRNTKAKSRHNVGFLLVSPAKLYWFYCNQYQPLLAASPFQAMLLYETGFA